MLKTDAINVWYGRDNRYFSGFSVPANRWGYLRLSSKENVL